MLPSYRHMVYRDLESWIFATPHSNEKICSVPKPANRARVHTSQAVSVFTVVFSWTSPCKGVQSLNLYAYQTLGLCSLTLTLILNRYQQW